MLLVCFMLYCWHVEPLLNSSQRALYQVNILKTTAILFTLPKPTQHLKSIWEGTALCHMSLHNRRHLDELTINHSFVIAL
ncbi:hypothetical protein KC19_4G093400 [Ceratodon purpureus]|uniref:Secreted protein n=1 Tax=Ceratodon purpureus TaxID=3225 RepID=A0A8T0I790_CERPU|nr:hypothetical protein KC19_4G093400 [Ceratodon purpureus]